MAIKTNTSKNVFVSGRGNVSGEVAKSNEEVLHEESETLEGGMDAVPSDSGAKPIYATGETPFHEGRGLGRGHGPETAKNA